MGKTVEKAEIEGMEEITQEDKEKNGDLSREELLEQVIKATDLTLNREVREDAVGAYHGSGMYILSFYTAENKGGQKSWPECDLVEGGCEYRKEGKPHTHRWDVGIRGAELAMAAMGYIHMQQKGFPEIKEIEGKKFWICEIEFEDTLKHNKFNDFFAQPVMKDTYKGLIFDEHGYACAISKCMRKGILRLIPGALRDKWKKAFSEGKTEIFTKESVQEFRQERKEERKEEKAEQQPQPEPEPEEEAVDNAELDKATQFSDWIVGMKSCKTEDDLEKYWKNNEDEMKKHPGWQTLKNECNRIKKELSK